MRARFSLSASRTFAVAGRRRWFPGLWLVIDLHALFKGRFCCFPKDPLEDVETWAESVDKVLGCKGETLILIPQQPATNQTDTGIPPFPAGQIAFREFLKSEYSEENILFWLACEEHKKIKTVPEMISSANRIYSEFVQTEAPKQVKEPRGNLRQSSPFTGLPRPPPASPGLRRLVSDQHRLWNQGEHHQEHLPAEPDVLRHGAEAHLQPDGQGLLPALPEVRHLSGPAEEDRVQVTVLWPVDRALRLPWSSSGCAGTVAELAFPPSVAPVKRNRFHSFSSDHLIL